MEKPTTPKLKVMEGSRHELEYELARVLFTEFGKDRYEQFERAHNRLKRKGKLKPVK
jgi:hypothetical protein